MNLPFELHVALRYLLAKRKQAFISLISLISTIGVAVGVMALIIALALMTGLQGELRDRILGSSAHVYAWKTGGLDDYQADVKRLQQIDGVVGAAPTVLGKALVQTSQGDAFITLKGIDPDLEPNVTDIRRADQLSSLLLPEPAVPRIVAIPATAMTVYETARPTDPSRLRMRLNPAGRSRCPQIASISCHTANANSPITVIQSSTTPKGCWAISANAPF